MDKTHDNIMENVKEILRESNWVKEEAGEFNYEIFPGSYDETILGKDVLKSIMESTDPRETFSESLMEMADDYKYDYGINFLMDEIKEEYRKMGLEDSFEETEDEIRDFLLENVTFYYDEANFTQPLNVTLMMDTGDLNYDFTLCNLLNYYSRFEEGEIQEESPVLWLCREMGEEEGLRKILSYYHDERDDTPRPEVSPFIESVERELINGASHMLQLTFLFQLDLPEYISLKEAIAAEKYHDKSYDIAGRSGNGAVTISKKTTCGLMDFWNGGGSLFEIELPKDLEIPIRMIHDVTIDELNSRWGVQKVYGFLGEPWKRGEILNIRPHTDHELRIEAPELPEIPEIKGKAEEVLPRAKELSIKLKVPVKVYDTSAGGKDFSIFDNGREYNYGFDETAAKRIEEKGKKKDLSR